MKSDSRRRQTLKLLLGAGVVSGASQPIPVKWIKPVISTAVLPGHAQATGSMFECSFIGPGDNPAQLEGEFQDANTTLRWFFEGTVLTEAAIGTEVLINVTAEGSTADDNFGASVESNGDTNSIDIGVEGTIETSNSSEGNLELNIDIDGNGEVDCSLNGFTL